MLEWNVFYYSINQHTIEKMNIFRHSGFNEAVQKLLKTETNRISFEEELRRELMYVFWSRAEYEVIISPWGFKEGCEELKVDIYSQVMMNWSQFVDYVWDSKNEVFG